MIMASPDPQDSTIAPRTKQGLEGAAISDKNVDNINDTSEDEFEKAWKRALRNGEASGETLQPDTITAPRDIITIRDSPESSPYRDNGSPTANKDMNQNISNLDPNPTPLPQTSWNRGVQGGVRTSFGNQKNASVLTSKILSDPALIQSHGEKRSLEIAFGQNISGDTRIGDSVHPDNLANKKSRQKKKSQEKRHPKSKKQKVQNTKGSKSSLKPKARIHLEPMKSPNRANDIKYIFPNLLDENNQEIGFQLKPFKLTNFTQIFLPAFLTKNKALLEKMGYCVPIRRFWQIIRTYGKYSLPDQSSIQKELRTNAIKLFCEEQIKQALKVYNLEEEIQKMEPGEELEITKKELFSLRESAKDNLTHSYMAFQGEQNRSLEHDDYFTANLNEYVGTDSDGETPDDAASLLSSTGGKSVGHISMSPAVLRDKMVSHSQDGILQLSDQMLHTRSAKPQTSVDSNLQSRMEVDAPASNSSIPSAGLPNTISNYVTASTETISVLSGSPVSSMGNRNSTDRIQPLQPDIRGVEIEVDTAESDLIHKYYPGSETVASAPHCLSCAEVGHRASECPLFTCSTCGVDGAHFSIGCPRTQRCSRCLQCGHVKEVCPEKLAASPDERPPCDLCTSKNHPTVDCDLLWRSYKPNSIKVKFLIQHLLIYCYSCGEKGHYGSECGIRRGRKGDGSHSWSKDNWKLYVDPMSNRSAISPGKGQTLPTPTRGFVIKGQARKNVPGQEVADEDDDTPFIGRKVTKPTPHNPQGKQHIRLKKSSNEYAYGQHSHIPPSAPRASLQEFPGDQRGELGRAYGRHDRERSVSPPPRRSPDRFDSRSRGYYLRSDDRRENAGAQGRSRGRSFDRRGRGARGRSGNAGR
jgi:hypothetical protein